MPLPRGPSVPRAARDALQLDDQDARAEGSSVALLLCVAVPALVGWGACRLLDLGLRDRRRVPD